jgi:predicted GNAT family acetyltransferase
MQNDEIQVRRLDDGDHRGAFVVERDGKRLAEMTYSMAGKELAMIDHTEVSDELRGRGVGRKLLDAAVAWARAGAIKIVPVCPYAASQFERDPSIRDVLST